jgi:competence protein ComEA
MPELLDPIPALVARAPGCARRRRPGTARRGGRRGPPADGRRLVAPPSARGPDRGQLPAAPGDAGPPAASAGSLPAPPRWPRRRSSSRWPARSTSRASTTWRRSRVTDLITAAGGAATDADLGDGPRQPADRRAAGAGPAPGRGAPSTATGGAPAGETGSGVAPAAPIDLNAASEADLDALPGVGPTTARAIVAYREAHGPFHQVDDLTDVQGIGPARLDALRELVRV